MAPSFASPGSRVRLAKQGSVPAVGRCRSARLEYGLKTNARPVLIVLLASIAVQASAAARSLAEVAPARCAWLDSLPRDLSSSTDAALSRYGGQQDTADGSMDLHGLAFRVPQPAVGMERTLRTSIKVMVASVLKIRCAPQERVTCRVRVTPAEDGVENLMHVGGQDSGTVLIPVVSPRRGGAPRRLDVHLDFSVLRDSSADACLGTEFMLQMRPVSSVKDELRCPPTPAVALPPPKFSVGGHGGGESSSVGFSSDQLMITPDKLQEHAWQGTFTYPMSIHVHSRQAIISAEASFDWILADLYLELARIDAGDLAGSDGRIIVHSNETEAEDNDGQFERTAKLYASVPAGYYRLLLRDVTTTQLQAGVASAAPLRALRDDDDDDDDEDENEDEGLRRNGLNMCVPFSFNLDILPEGVFNGPGGRGARLETQKSDTEASLVAIEPATAQNLDVQQPLRLVFSFSSLVARFGKDGDSSLDSGRGGVDGVTEVHCSSSNVNVNGEKATTQGRDEWSDWKKITDSHSWVGSALCTKVFVLRPSASSGMRIFDSRHPEKAAPSVSENQRIGDVLPSTVYLREGARLAGAASEVVVTFPPAALLAGVQYSLHIEEDYLKTDNGAQIGVKAHSGGAHLFRAVACDCHGHGRCDVERRCACTAGFGGSDCQRCTEGHRLSDTGICIVEKSSVVCSHESCNGHGACLQPSGGVTCMCVEGYSNTQDGSLCGACAEGFEGYPNCKPEVPEEFREREAGDQEGGCSALPVLPRNLNVRGMLEGESESLHIQGDYWLDIRARSHVMHVAIRTPSVLHVRVDISELAGSLGVAIAVERLVSSGVGKTDSGESERSKAGGSRRRLQWQPLTDLRNGGEMTGGQGSLQAMLQPPRSEGPNLPDVEQRYRIVIAYEVLGALGGGPIAEICRSLGLQLSITPLTEVTKVSAAVDAACPASSDGHVAELPEHVDISPHGWSLNGSFFVTLADAGTRIMRDGTAIQPITLRIPEVPGKVGRLSASVGYRFEISSFGLLLEADRTGSSQDAPRCQALSADTHAPEAEGYDFEERRETAQGGGVKRDSEGTKDEWSEWKDIGANTGKSLGTGGVDTSGGNPATAHHEEQEEGGGDDDGDAGMETTGQSRDGAYDFHDLINSAFAKMLHHGHQSEDQHTHVPSAATRFKSFPGLTRGFPAGFHMMPHPFSHFKRPDWGPDGVAGGTAGQRTFWGDDGDEGDEDEDDPFTNFFNDDDFGNRRRRLLRVNDRKIDVVGGSNGAHPQESHDRRRLLQLVDRSEEEDRASVSDGRVRVETMLRPPAAGSEDMFACRGSRNVYNRNVLLEALPPGSYTLWLVRDTDFDSVLRSKGGLTEMKCLAMEVSFAVTFEDPEPTPVTCAARTLPAALHEPGFLGPTGTRVHIQDTFYMRNARLMRRHFMDFTVRGQGPSLFRVHVESAESVDIRLSVFLVKPAVDGSAGKTTIVDVENPHIVGGLRGDAILALLPPGAYKLQFEFLNPGGAPGLPAWELGAGASGQSRHGGSRDGCEVLDLELALLPLEDYGDEEGWQRQCPGHGSGVESIPAISDVAGGKDVVRIGDSFLLPAVDGGNAPGESLLARLREDSEPVFWAHTRNGSRGYVLATYPLDVEAPAVLRAGLHSDFVHDDLVLDLMDMAGRLVLTGAHRRSFNHIQSVLQPGRYLLKIRQSLSAAEVLSSKSSGEWVAKIDSKGKRYFFNRVLQSSQWHRPPELAGSSCARFSFWLSLDQFVSADDCHVAADAMHLPASLDTPGMLGSHSRAYLQALFAVGGPQGLKPTGEGNSLHQTIRFSISRKSRIHAVVVPVSDDVDQSILTELTLHTVASSTPQDEEDGNVVEVEHVARGEFLSPSAYKRDQFDSGGDDDTDGGSPEGVLLGARQVLSAIVAPNIADEGTAHAHLDRSNEHNEARESRSFLLELRHMLPPVEAFKCTKFSLLVSIEPIYETVGDGVEEDTGAKLGEDGTGCAGLPAMESKWPEVAEDLSNLFACTDAKADPAFRCWQDLHGLRVVQHVEGRGSPARHRFALTLEAVSHVRIEMGFPLYSFPLVSSIVPLGCADGQVECADGKSAVASVLSSDRPGSSLLVGRWLPRGRYLITLAQQAPPFSSSQEEQSATSGPLASSKANVCARFSFRLMVEGVPVGGGDAEAQGRGTELQRLPLSLDSVGYLKFATGRLHLFGNYAMPRPGPSAHEIHFSLRKPSQIRVDAMPQRGAPGHVSLALVRLGDLGGKTSTATAENVKDIGGTLPPLLRRQDFLSKVPPGRYKLVVEFEPFDSPARLPSHGRVRGSLQMQLAITPSADEVEAYIGGGHKACAESTIEVKQSSKGPFHLFLPAANFRVDHRQGTLLKVVPVQTVEESVVRVTVWSAFSTAALYTALTRMRPQTELASASAEDSGSAWVCSPGYNMCQLHAVVPAGEYSLAFYHPVGIPSTTAGTGAGAQCLRFSLRIITHPTRLKYGMACHGARPLPADLSAGALDVTSTDAAGKSFFRTALTWADPAMLVPEGAMEDVVVRETVLAVLPASAVHDEYLLHVRYRDARPAATIEVMPFTKVGESIQEGVWETVYSRSHLSVDQEALFRYKGRELSLHPPKGEGLRLGLRVSSTLAFRHDPCPTWGLAVNLQKEEHVRRAGQCPPGAGSRLPGNTLAINPSGFGLEELDFSAPIEDWPPKDASCPHQEVCGHSTDTAIEVRRASQVQASLAFEGALASYSLALIAVSEDAATTTIVAAATPVFRSAAEGGEAPQIRVPSDTNGAAPLSTLSQVALAQELPRGRYVVRITRTSALAPSSVSGGDTVGLCSMLLWRLAVSPLSEPGSVDDSKNVQQRPFVLDMHPPGLHQVPTSIAELSVRLLLSEPLMPSTAGAAPDMVHVCPKKSVPASAWNQDVVVDSKAGAGCFAVSWLRAVARDGQEFEGEEMGWEVMVGLATANMHVGEQYVLWWRGSGWPRGALSGKRMLQPPPFTFSVAVTACSGHGVLAADGSCDCDAQRAGFLCEACSEAVPSSACVSATKNLVTAHQEPASNAPSIEGPATTDPPIQGPATISTPPTAQGSAIAGGKSAAAVPGWIGGGQNDAKYSKIIRDDGAVDADSVVELDDGTKIAEQKKKTASAVSQVTAAKALASASNSGNKTGRHRVCKIFPCDDETARALKVASVLLAAVGLSMGVVSCVCKRRSHSFFYSRVRTNPDDDL